MNISLRAAVLALFASAIQANAKPGQTTNTANNGTFGTIQISTDDEDRFAREWDVATPGAQLTQSIATVANKPLFTHIIFYGCTANKAGDCDVTADIAYYAPDGTLENEQKAAVIWRGKAPERPKNLYLGAASIGFGTDDKGPFGAHRVVFKVTDNVARVTLTTEQTLTVAPAK